MLAEKTSASGRLSDLPWPDVEALAHSKRLEHSIRQAIDRQGGAIRFSSFMQAALYETGLGYYSAGAAKLGRAGDFVTAPEISSLFSRCLARQCAEILQLTTAGSILELGAGSGRMAGDIMLELEDGGNLPQAYLILETSADLRQRQQAFLQASLAPELYARFRWLDELPKTSFTGVILANEVMDALPVERICYERGQYHVMQVGYDDAGFIWKKRPVEQELSRLIDARLRTCQGHLPDVYKTEINTLLPGWIQALADVLQQGLVLLIDYGYTRTEYYHPQRVDGTLLCHYRHRAHHDPFLHVGLQDISASVDFTAVAEAAGTAGLSVKGFCSQVHFLLACGLDKLLTQYSGDDEQVRLKLSGEVKRLCLPTEMGERFKVIALARGIDETPSGFGMSDQREKL